jgi:DNA processing protein
MLHALSENTQAILLLTAPLLAGRGGDGPRPLGVGEYRRVAARLHALQAQPADLLGEARSGLLADGELRALGERLNALLGRGFQLSQAVERWSSRSIGVFSRADDGYPARWKARLRGEAPPVVYFVGDAGLFQGPALAVVGSRDADSAALALARRAGALAAGGGLRLVSGGARGVDQAAMTGALEAGGAAVGVLAESLERAATRREHRQALLAGRLLLASPYDPAARFQVGQAMGRNKLVYALADGALVAASDHGRGGTWSGAVEELEKRRSVPVFVPEGSGPGLAALRARGALPWPDPVDGDALQRGLVEAAGRVDGDTGLLLFGDANTGAGPQPLRVPGQASEPGGVPGEPPVDSGDPQPHGGAEGLSEDEGATPSIVAVGMRPCAAPGGIPGSAVADAPGPATDGKAAQRLFALVSDLLAEIDRPLTERQVAERLGVQLGQARDWLQRLVAAGRLRRTGRPVRYGPTGTSLSLEDGVDQG